MTRLARNPVLADSGRRLMGGATGLRASDVALSDELALTLRLGATACQVDEAEFVRRAIAEKASRLGLPALMDTFAHGRIGPVGLACAGAPDDRRAAVAALNEESGEAGAAFRAPRLGNPLATRGSDESVAFNSDGDLIAVPDFRQATIPRFASGP